MEPGAAQGQHGEAAKRARHTAQLRRASHPFPPSARTSGFLRPGMNWPDASTKQAADVITMRFSISVLQAVKESGSGRGEAGTTGQSMRCKVPANPGSSSVPHPCTLSHSPLRTQPSLPLISAHPPQKPRPESATKRTTVGHCPTAVFSPPMTAGCTTAPPPWLLPLLVLLPLFCVLGPPPARLVVSGQGRGGALVSGRFCDT